MTNIFSTPEKGTRRERLFEIGMETLREQGWKVERIPRFGKSSVRQITKGTTRRKVSIRTSQDTWIAFPRNQADNAWETLADVDLVVAVSVDNADDPKFAQVHLIEADEMRRRFDRAYAARKAAGHKIQKGRGLWIPLYEHDESDPVNHVGGGAGLEHPPIARIPLAPNGSASAVVIEDDEENIDKPLTIAEAKRRLAIALGVNPSNIKITVEA